LITIPRRKNIYLRHCWDAIPRNALYGYRGFGGNCCPILRLPCVSTKTNINTALFAFQDSACETDVRCRN
jgi:hypothetical protein